MLGIVSKKRDSVSRSSVERMLAYSTTNHFQEERIWQGGFVAFGQRHRHNTPESKYVTLPYRDEQHDLCIVADCRIDNRPELATLLSISDASLEKLADAHLILKAYRKWGRDCPKQLVGDFAFAIWDETRHELFMARDHLGIKRLYFFEDDDFLVFSSAFSSISALSFVQKEVNRYVSHAFLLRKRILSNRTFIKGIESVPPGHTLAFREQRSNVKPYWSLEEYAKPLDAVHLEDAILEARRLFERAVEDRLRSDKKIASELSGGLDCSGIISCIASKISPETAFDVFSNVEQCPTAPAIINERNHIDCMLNEFPQLIPNFIDEDSYEDIGHEVRKATEILGFPTTTLLALFGLPQMHKVEEKGVGVMLSGYGGDQCVSYRGHQDLHDLVQQKEWVQVVKSILSPQHKTRRQRLSDVVKHLASPFFPKRLKVWYQGKRQKSWVRELENVLASDLTKSLEETDAFDGLSASIFQLEKIREISYIQSIQSLQGIADFHGAEYRFPMLDIRLLRFFLQIPVQMRIHDGIQRYMYRKVIEPFAPARITWRKDKAGSIAPGLKKLLDAQQHEMRKDLQQLLKMQDMSNFFKGEAYDVVSKHMKKAFYILSFCRFIESIDSDKTLEKSRRLLNKKSVIHPK